MERHRILIVEEEPTLRRAFARCLHGLDAEITPADDTATATYLLSQRRFDVVVSDACAPPSQSGVDLLAEARRVSPGTRRVLMTSDRDFSIASDAINRAAVHRLILKPFTPESLRATMTGLLSSSAFGDEVATGPASLVAGPPPGIPQNPLHRAEARRVSLHPRAPRLNPGSEEHPLVAQRTAMLLQCLVAALELRDAETQWHSRRVAAYARHLGERVGLSPEQLLIIERGALLHDVGKIGISDSILLKPGKLTAEEWVEMERHPMLGYQLLKDMDFLGDARLIVLQHQERWDGKGYPGGLRGEELHLGSRIFHIVDAYDAITSDRPYRAAQGHDIAREEIRRHRGTQFDPALVDVFCEVPQQRWQALRAETQNGPQASKKTSASPQHAERPYSHFLG